MPEPKTLLDRGARDELRRVASEATPGPYTVRQDRFEVSLHGAPLADHDADGCIAFTAQTCHDYHTRQTRATYDYLAKLDPATVLALLDQIDELEARLLMATDALENP